MIIKTIKRFFFRNDNYWNSRYKKGGNSGSGSYGRLANFKAEIINGFIKDYNVSSIIDFGCGDGNVLSLLEGYDKYIGFDVSENIIKKCIERFEDNKNKEFYVFNATNKYQHKADLSLSLDVIFHLVRNKDYFEYLNSLFAFSQKHVIIYSSNQSGEDVNHVKERVFTEDISLRYPEWKLIKVIKNRFPFNNNLPDTTSRSNFYFFSKTFL